MSTLNTIPRSFSSSAEAANREQKRRAHLETEERNSQIPAFMFKGFGFRPYFSVRGPIQMDGPLCPKSVSKDVLCFSKLKGEGTETTKASCEVCGNTFDLPHGFQRFREIAHTAYEGRQNFLQSGGQIQTLDVPFEAIKAEDEDETRRIRIKWSQQDGRNQAIVYFIELNGNKEGEKVHGFVDMDREEFRHDAKDVTPGKVISAVKVVFPRTEIDVQYKQNEERAE